MGEGRAQTKPIAVAKTFSRHLPASGPLSVK